MKKYLGWMALVLGWTLAGWASSCPVKLPGLAAMGRSVESVEIIVTKSLGAGEDAARMTTTNTWTPTSGSYEDYILADSVVLVANLKRGYENARFAYETDHQPGQEPQESGFISSGSSVPFFKYEGGEWELATHITDLLVEPVKSTLTLDPDGGTVKPATKALTYDGTYGELPEPTRTGYLFQGWWGEGRAWTGTETVETLTNQTFTARWRAVAYTVRYDATEGTGTMADQPFAYDEAQTLAPCTFTRANYVFNCWSNTVTGVTYEDAQEVSNLAEQEGAVVTLAAVWVAKKYSVNYHPNFDPDVVTSVTVNYGTPIELKGSLGRLGYTFLGWGTTPDARRPAYSGSQSVDTTTFAFNERGEFHLYAVWAPYFYTVTFAAGGGTGAMEPQAREYDDGVALPACAFTRTGYAFDGWRANTGMTYEAGSTENLSWQSGVTLALTALWRPVTYTVVFAANDARATGEMAALDMVYATPRPLPACAFAKDGYDFLGWALEPAGEVAYADGVQVGNLSATDGDAVTLYARWKAQSYTVVLDANGGVFGTRPSDPAVSNLTVTVDEPYGTFPAVENLQPKLVFGDWRTPAGVVVAATETVPPPSAGVTKLVAHWVKDDPLARAVDAEDLDFNWRSTWGLGRWVEVKDGSEAPDGDAACAQIFDDGDADIVTMTTQVVGPGTLTFQWKILSLSQPQKSGSTAATIWARTPERLFFDVGETRICGLAGSSTLFYHVTSFNGQDAATYERKTSNPGWVGETVRIDAAAGETNTLAWTFHYIKDDPTPGKAWVNAVQWVPDGTREDADVRALLGLSPTAAVVDYNLAVSDLAKTGGQMRVAVTLTRAEDGVPVVNRAVVGTLVLLAAETPDGPWTPLAATAENGTFAAGETATFTVPCAAGSAPAFFKAVIRK